MNGNTSDTNDNTNTIIKAKVNIGIRMILANIDIRFTFSKKNAMIKISDTLVATLIPMLSANHLGIFIDISADLIGLNKIAIPTTQAKLIKNPASNADRGLTSRHMIPAKPIEDRASYSLLTNGANSNTIAMIVARRADIVKLHIYR